MCYSLKSQGQNATFGVKVWLVVASDMYTNDKGVTKIVGVIAT